MIKTGDFSKEGMPFADACTIAGSMELVCPCESRCIDPEYMHFGT